MTAHPQTQPMPGAVPAAAPAPPVTAGTASRPKGTSRNARIALGLSLLVATAGVSFAAGHMTAESAGGTSASPFAAGAMPMAAAAGSDAAVTTDATTTSSPSAGIGGGGPAIAAAVAGASATSAEVAQTTQAASDGLPEGRAGGRPGSAGLPGAAEGTVAGITDSSLSITAADGTELTFVVDGTTTWVEQEAIDASVVRVGDAVAVEAPLGPDADDTEATIATQVVLSTAGV